MSRQFSAKSKCDPGERRHLANKVESFALTTVAIQKRDGDHLESIIKSRIIGHRRVRQLSRFGRHFNDFIIFCIHFF